MDPLTIGFIGFVGVFWTVVGVSIYGGLSKSARRRREEAVVAKDKSVAARERLRVLLSQVAGGHPVRVGDFTTIGEDGTNVESGLELAVGGLCRDLDVAIDRTFHGFAGLGDPELDPLLRVGGLASLRFAILDVECRAALRALVRGSVRVADLRLENGELAVKVPTDGFTHGHPGLDSAAHAVGTLARRLDAPSDVVARLVANAANDPLPAMRLGSIAALLGEHARDPRTQPAVQAAMNDASAEVRLRAAQGAAGHRALPTLIALALDPNLDDAVSAGAIIALGAHLPLDRLEPVLDQAQRGPGDKRARSRTIDALIQALRARPEPAALRALETLARSGHGAYGPDVVAAMTAIPREGIEPALLEALASWSLDRKRTIEAAARALGAVGTAEAVLPLQEAAERGGGAIASVARQAISAIQARIASAPGRLALAGDDEGKLSLSTDEAGRVSLPDGSDLRKP